MRHIAFIGKARSGKDTAGDRLTQRWMYTRLAFADPLKEAALRINAYVHDDYGPYGRLSTVVKYNGWERAKDRFPEVRRLLQETGEAMRALDPDFWIRQLVRKVEAANEWNLPVVVTDCRYRNEADTLRDLGFHLVRIVRPNSEHAMSPETARHPSETELDDYPVSDTLINDGTVADLHVKLDDLVRRI